MDRAEHLLMIAGEEGCEIAQRVSKALRFGIAEVQPGQEKNNAERIVYEYADLVAVMTMLDKEGIVEIKGMADMIAAKTEKVEKFLEYSRKQGRLAETQSGEKLG